jgi:hypothetical protein
MRCWIATHNPFDGKPETYKSNADGNSLDLIVCVRVCGAVLCCVVWCGVVWCGELCAALLEWCVCVASLLWCGVLWCGAVSGMVCCVCCDVLWCRLGPHASNVY